MLPRNIKKRNKMSKVNKIIDQNPELLHKAWRQAVRNYGDKASFKMLTEAMNTLLDAWGHDIHLKEHNVYQFFKLQKGSLKREKSVPLLTPEKKEKRVEWCQWMQNLKIVSGDDFYCGFLDEKHFYMSSGRCFRKGLPTAEFETDEDTYIQAPAVRSRRFAAKVMYMGVICPPTTMPANVTPPEDWHNGKIALYRVGKPKQLTRLRRNRRFVDDGPTNQCICGGDWRGLLPECEDDDPITVGELFDLVAFNFNIDPYIREHLCLSYKTKKRVNMANVDIYLIHEDEELLQGRELRDENGVQRDITIEDFDLTVLYLKGEIIVEDCVCDSAYMQATMEPVAKRIRKYYFWVPP